MIAWISPSLAQEQLLLVNKHIVILTKHRAIDELKNAVVFGLSDFKFPSFFRACEFVYVLLVGMKSIKMNQIQASSLSMNTSSEPFLGIPELKGRQRHIYHFIFICIMSGGSIILTEFNVCCFTDSNRTYKRFSLCFISNSSYFDNVNR